MESYTHDIGKVQQVSSVTIQCGAPATLLSILHDDGFPVEAVAPALPVGLQRGYTRLTFTVPVYASLIELLGIDLSTIISVETNEVLSDAGMFVPEMPGGAIDGVNKVFETSLPFAESTLVVLINGIEQLAGVHYTVTGDRTIELSDAPQPGDSVFVRYQSS